VADEGPWPIDEVARLAGTTARNVRLYQERGLLPPPERRGRIGLYGPAHLDRLRLVLALIARGYPMAAIRELLDAWTERRSLGDVLGFEEALSEPFTDEQPRTFSVDQLAALFPDQDEQAVGRAVELGVLVPAEDGFLAPVAALLEVGSELVADGIPLRAVLDVAAEITTASDRLASAFVTLFQEHVWEPFVEAGEPTEQWPVVTAALNRQRDLWARAMMPALGAAMQRRVDETRREVVNRELDQATPGRSAAS
jgi:DNA-binding transcriptional MerR regulator